MNNIMSSTVLALSMFAISLSVFAFDPEPGSGADGDIWALAFQPDGKVLIGGDFSIVKGVTYFRIARLNADDTPDRSFDAGRGPPRTHIARLNSDGSLDQDFNRDGSTAYVDGGILVGHIALQSDGNILITQHFRLNTGSGYTGRVLRLNEDGSVDENFSFASVRSGGFSSIALLPDGKIVIVGVS